MEISLDSKKLNISEGWKGCSVKSEYPLHQIAPYLGKMKSSMAKTLITSFTKEEDSIYDPFAGAGTVGLEAWASNRSVITNDLNPYAFVLTKAKLFPYHSIDAALDDIEKLARQADKRKRLIDLRKVPKWVRSFFHPETLREIITWADILRTRKNYFLLSCLLGILHHQRPGFLSYPSSHTVPYLRDKKYPRCEYPELYEYRTVKDRLTRKVQRALKKLPELNDDIARTCYKRNASILLPELEVNAIITSPPYMRQLEYARDNRLRLWFLGHSRWMTLDNRISPKEADFVKLMKSCLTTWRDTLNKAGICILVLGDTWSKSLKMSLPSIVSYIATSIVGGYGVLWSYTEQIPSERRVRRNCKGSIEETVLILQKRVPLVGTC